MSDIEIRSIKLQPTNSTTTAKGQNSNHTLADLPSEMQTGSILRGIVSEVRKNNDAIFTTKYGKFIIKSGILQKGDALAFSIIQNGKIFNGDLISINGNNNFVKGNILENCKFDSSLIYSPIKDKGTLNLNAKVTNLEHIAEVKTDNIECTVKYINLSKLNNNSAIYKILENIKIGGLIGCKIIHDIQSESDLAFHHKIVGEVLETNDQSKQLIKTIFGILSINTPNTKIPASTKLTLALQSVNNLPISTNNRETQQAKVEDFLFKLNENLLSLQQLEQSVLKLNNSDIAENKYVVNNKEINSRLLKSDDNSRISLARENIKELSTILNSEHIKDLSAALEQIKLVFSNMIINNNQWFVINLPFIHQQQVQDNKVLIKRQTKQLIRFIISVTTERTGTLQLDGLVKTAEDNLNKIEKFDLTIRFKKNVDKEIKKNILHIFSIGQKASRIRGDLNFQQVDDFPVLE